MTAAAPRLLSTGAAADVAQVSRYTLWGWARDGIVVPANRTRGGHLQWDPVDLLDQLAEPRRRVVAVTVRQDTVLVVRRYTGEGWELPTVEIARGETVAGAAVRAARELAGVSVDTAAEIARQVAPPPGQGVVYRACTAVEDDEAGTPGVGVVLVRWIGVRESLELLPGLPGAVQRGLQPPA